MSTLQIVGGLTWLTSPVWGVAGWLGLMKVSGWREDRARARATASAEARAVEICNGRPMDWQSSGWIR